MVSGWVLIELGLFCMGLGAGWTIRGIAEWRRSARHVAAAMQACRDFDAAMKW